MTITALSPFANAWAVGSARIPEMRNIAMTVREIRVATFGEKLLRLENKFQSLVSESARFKFLILLSRAKRPVIEIEWVHELSQDDVYQGARSSARARTAADRQ
jgi:hypothetical protein